MLRNSTLTIATVSALALAGTAHAGFDDFESFTLNQSINGQGQWTVEDSFGNSAELFDEAIIDDGTGNKVWQFSNEIRSTSYSNQPFSSKPALVAGETGAQLYNDYGVDHTMPNNPPLPSAVAGSNFFYGAWDFKSATGAAQPDLSLTVSPGGTQSTLRMSYLNMVDSGAGFDLVFYDTIGSTFNGPTTVASGLSYTDWHKVEMFIEFVDGIGPGAAGSEAGNDIVKILVDGNLVHTGTTWESYYYNNADGGPAVLPRAVDSLLFRQAGTANVANAGAGFYIDNVETSNVPEPASLALLGLGGLTLLKRKRA